ncbi:MAG: shikimate kinase [Muribaculaceae bacterium]|nr:shikimate kinase [Muribaculaceae bacterium]
MTEKSSNISNTVKPIFLIGFMGSGKTTLCNALTTRTNLKTIDLDDYVEKEAGMSIKEYFSLHGEDSFRHLESESLKKAAAEGYDIIACGGGTPCFNNNMELMNRLGETVYLHVPEERLFSRLVIARDHRPLIAQLDDDSLRRFIIDKIAEREMYYRKALSIFDASRLEDEEQIEQTSALFIEKYL